MSSFPAPENMSKTRCITDQITRITPKVWTDVSKRLGFTYSRYDVKIRYLASLSRVRSITVLHPSHSHTFIIRDGVPSCDFGITLYSVCSQVRGTEALAARLTPSLGLLIKNLVGPFFALKEMLRLIYTTGHLGFLCLPLEINPETRDGWFFSIRAACHNHAVLQLRTLYPAEGPAITLHNALVRE